MTQENLSPSGIPIKDIYTPEDIKGLNYKKDLNASGEPPFTRGPYPSMYRGQAWTARRLSGFNTPEETNALYKEEFKLGQTGFSVAPDMTTPSGMDADDPRAASEVGHAGVPFSTLQDMEICFADLPIDKVSTYLADRIGGFLTAMYLVMAEKRGIPMAQVRGTSANDLLAWSALNLLNQVSPEANLRYAVDLIEWCAEYAPKWNALSIDSYNARDNGVNAVQEIGLAMANGIQYIEEEKKRGRVPLDKFVKRFSFNTAVHNDIFEEACKLRAARRIWYKIITERYGITDPNCAKFRVHVQSSGSTHTYQEPYNNIIRIAFQVLAGVLGGAQSIHANGYDQSMLLSIRTGQLVQYESGATRTIDPLGGSYYIESLTNELEKKIWEFIDEVEAQGGLAKAISKGWVHRLYRDAIISYEDRIQKKEIPVVGVNIHRLDKEIYEVPIFKPDPKRSASRQIEKLKKLKKERDNAKVKQCLAKVEEATRKGENVMPATIDAIRNYATLGELSALQLKVYGEWKYPMGI
jgi:methylmalonyl-CoA mutase N-terminal domain/subunit